VGLIKIVKRKNHKFRPLTKEKGLCYETKREKRKDHTCFNERGDVGEEMVEGRRKITKPGEGSGIPGGK